MKIFTRMVVCLGTALLLTAPLGYFADAWLDGESSVLQAGCKLVLELQRTQALHRRMEMIARSQAAKKDIVAQLVAGRLSLREAISQFHAANAMIEPTDLEWVPIYQVPTDDEGVARQVLVWVRNQVGPGPSSKSQRVLDKLEREFQELFGRPPFPNLVADRTNHID